jgi:tetratricopeptide (TPR) repeat protein
MILPLLFVSTVVLLGPTPGQDPVMTEPTQVDAIDAADPFIVRGLAFYKRLRFRAAREEFEKAVGANPSSAAAHFYLGYTLYKIGEPTKRMSPEKVLAVEHFERCYELDPGFKPVWSWH